MVFLWVGTWQIILPVFGEYPRRAYNRIGIAKETPRTTYSHVLKYFVSSKQNPATWKQITPSIFAFDNLNSIISIMSLIRTEKPDGFIIWKLNHSFQLNFLNSLLNSYSNGTVINGLDNSNNAL